MFDWEEGDRFSFEDSDRFEEDSLCSWISEPESLCNNWRGWKKQNGNNSNNNNNNTNNIAANYHATFSKNKDGQILSLGELSARVVACHIPFEVVEHVYPPVPEQLQLRIAFWSFPENEEDIRLYSCLANGSADEFQRGEHLYKAKAVKDLLQIGFHLSATVTPPQTLGVSKGSYNVAVTFDRRRITKCNCTCGSNASWCAHVVAVCLYRIHQPAHVRLRAPVSESLSQLRRDQLLKFAQYLISELPQQILPTAQRLLDELLSSQQTAINATHGAPDPTAGASANEQTTWCLDESTLHDNIHKILIKLCAPSPIVYSDVNYLSSTAPPAAAEWSSLLRPLRGREPEGMWNLLSIVREMLRRSDSNAIPLLEILTDEVLSCDQILVWWFNTKVSLHMGSGGHGGRGSVHSNTHASQHACSSLCDELVVLWRLSALNPALSSQDRQILLNQLCSWHVKTLEHVWKSRSGGNNSANAIKRADIDVFSGFRPAMEACLLDWSDYPISGITYHEGGGRRWYSTYVHARFSEHNSNENSDGLSVKRGRSVDVSHSSGWWLASERKYSHQHNNGQNHHFSSSNQDGKNSSNRSSLSSEGFCENEQEGVEAVEENPIKTWTRTFVSRTNSSLRSTLGRCHSNSLEGASQCVEIVDSNTVQKKKPSSDDACPKVECESSSELQNQNVVRPLIEKSGDASESQQSSDEYQLYYYDPRVRIPSPEHVHEYRVEEERFSVSVKKIDDPFEILFARAEALHAHGHTKEACRLAVRLAEELLVNPPNLMVELPPPPTRGKRVRRFNPASHQISLLASATLAKVAFLCSVLGENTEHHHLAFRVGIFGLEMARPPASTKALEVKLVNQEQDLVLLLKRLPLTEAELKLVCERAEQLREGQLVSRGDALLPLMLASYIFDALVLSGRSLSQDGGKSSDELLGFEAAVAALGLKANVSEAEHPLLCEGTRRQRGELAISLLVHYKDDQEKLAKIMDKLLDKEVHQMYKAPPLSAYYNTSSSQPTAENATNRTEENNVDVSSQPEVLDSRENEDIEAAVPDGLTVSDAEGNQETTVSVSVQDTDSRNKRSMWQMHRGSEDPGDRSEGASSPGWEEDYKAWEAKFRCTNFRTTKKHSRGMASIDSSAPETTSSDNSPTVVRRSTWMKSGGPGSDSGSSGESSDSFASSSSDDKVPRTKARETESLPQVILANRFPTEGLARSGTLSVKMARFKGKRSYPNVPNQPSEASAHFMFELAKTVLTKAGGNSSTAVLFTQPSAGQNHRGPHRALHMCAFQIGLYALGLHNAVSPNWLSRTYSSHVSWITGQAMEIGHSAINFLIETWEGHLTPPEVASLADRASRGRDPAMVRAAAELALSCLPHAHALNPNEIQRALIQCKEQSSEMLERACLAVESAAKGGGVCPEVLFDVARKWYELYEESLEDHRNSGLSEAVPNNVETESVTEMITATRTDHSTIATHSIHVGPIEGVITTAPSVQVIPQLACPPVTYTLAYPTAPYGYMQTPFPHSPMPLHAAYVPSPAAYPYGALTNLSYYTPAATNASHLRHSTPGIYSSPVVGVPVSRAQSVLPLGGHAVMTAPPPPAPAIPSQQPQMQNPITQLNQQQMGYMLAAYRVGMLAMETLARRVHDDRPQAKYARNPPYGEDVKWLLSVAKKLGTSYLQEFCICTVNSVASPFILHEIVLEAGHYLARSASTPLPTPMRSHLLTPLIQKCQQMFIACTHFKMYHITPGEYDEFVNIIRSARSAFQLTPGGMVQFNELLQSLRRSKSCKKELWQRIANSLATGSI